MPAPAILVVYVPIWCKLYIIKEKNMHFITHSCPALNLWFKIFPLFCLLFFYMALLIQDIFFKKTFTAIFGVAHTYYAKVPQINTSAQSKIFFWHNGLLYKREITKLGQMSCCSVHNICRKDNAILHWLISHYSTCFSICPKWRLERCSVEGGEWSNTIWSLMPKKGAHDKETGWPRTSLDAVTKTYTSAPTGHLATIPVTSQFLIQTLKTLLGVSGTSGPWR